MARAASEQRILALPNEARSPFWQDCLLLQIEKTLDPIIYLHVLGCSWQVSNKVHAVCEAASKRRVSQDSPVAESWTPMAQEILCSLIWPERDGTGSDAFCEPHVPGPSNFPKAHLWAEHLRAPASLITQTGPPLQDVQPSRGSCRTCAANSRRKGNW